MPRVPQLVAALVIGAGACRRPPPDTIELSGAFQPGGKCAAQLHGRVDRSPAGISHGTKITAVGPDGVDASYVVVCEADGASISFFVELPDTGAALRTGTYRVSPEAAGDEGWQRRGWAGFQADVTVPGRYDAGTSGPRRYGADVGTLTITRVTPDSTVAPGIRDVSVRVEGSFAVKAHGYWHFE